MGVCLANAIYSVKYNDGEIDRFAEPNPSIRQQFAQFSPDVGTGFQALRFQSSIQIKRPFPRLG
jgi:hypothetical protein